jgi:hypothetical protein
MEVTALSFRTETEDQEQAEDGAHLEDGERPLIAELLAQRELHYRPRDRADVIRISRAYHHYGNRARCSSLNIALS